MYLWKSLFLVGVLEVFAFGQDISPLGQYHVWHPMTGFTSQQIDQAIAAGYDTLFVKICPALTADCTDIVDKHSKYGLTHYDEKIKQATDKGMKVIIPILGWGGLGQGQFWDVDENGEKIYDRLDPFWPEAMERVELYFGRVIDHYKANSNIVAFAPTWGIYGEAGFTNQIAGRSKHALARFNEWRKTQNLLPLDKLPTNKTGPNTEFNRFIRFRYLYLEEKFDAMVRRLKKRASDIPVGFWQELYPVVGYLWTMVEIPSADFALYESCLPYQTVHHPEKSLAETMGFRYKCHSPEDYRNYYLPLLARKRGEGQRFMGCQLSNDYAVDNYGWDKKKTEQARFDQWEDEFSPHLKRLLDTPLESPDRDVLLVFPNYTAAALTNHGEYADMHAIDTKFIGILLRMYGCQMVRYGTARFDKLSVEQMNRFRLIVVPCASYLIPQTYEKLKHTDAVVLFTGSFARSFDAEITAFGQKRQIDGTTLHYLRRPAGEVTITSAHKITKQLRKLLAQPPLRIPTDETFAYEQENNDVSVLMRCGSYPLLSTRYNSHFIFIHGSLFAGLAYDPNRKIPQVSGSRDASADEADLWGKCSSSNPQNVVGRVLIKNILDFAGVEYRVPDPKPRTATRFLGDHMEVASISANIVYNNTGQAQTLTVRTPYQPTGYRARLIGKKYETEVKIPPYSYLALQPLNQNY
jgi:hypothetical protein